MNILRLISCLLFSLFITSVFALPEEPDLSGIKPSRIQSHIIKVDEVLYSCVPKKHDSKKQQFFYTSGMFSGCPNLVGGKGTKIGENIYDYDQYGNPLYYYCPEDRIAAHIDSGKDNPGLFTVK